MVVGGTGFIGRHIVINAAKYNFKTTVLSLNKPSSKNTIEGVNYIQINLSQTRLSHKKKIGGPYDYVINLLGYIDHSKFNEGGKGVIENHYVGLLNLIEILDLSRLKNFIQIGSSDEYGNNKAPQNEEMRELPISSYSLSKLNSSQFLQMLNRTENFPVVIFRLFLTYGPGQDDQRLVPQVIKGLLSNDKFQTSMGDQLRDFCYVDDIVKGVLEALKNPKADGEIINLASGNPVPVNYIVKLIKNKLGRGRPEFGKISYREGENMELYADITKAKKILKWIPTTSLEEGIDKTIKHYIASLK